MSSDQRRKNIGPFLVTWWLEDEGKWGWSVAIPPITKHAAQGSGCPTPATALSCAESVVRSLTATTAELEQLRSEVCRALVVYDTPRHAMVCQVCDGTGLGGASVVHERDCALANLTDTWPGDNVLRVHQTSWAPEQKDLEE